MDDRVRQIIEALIEKSDENPELWYELGECPSCEATYYAMLSSSKMSIKTFTAGHGGIVRYRVTIHSGGGKLIYCKTVSGRVADEEDYDLLQKLHHSAKAAFIKAGLNYEGMLNYIRNIKADDIDGKEDKSQQ
jgi:hypothetical protein